jgi:hypothetical protein
VNTIEQERQVLDQLIPQLEAEGYTVYLSPSRELLPAFMKGYSPDAIALRSDKNLVFEVIVEGSASPAKARQLKKRFEKAKNWELRILYARPAVPRTELPIMNTEAIDSSIASATKLASVGQTSAAVLIGWGTFEALGRALSPDQFAPPQTPARLIEVLAGKGIITPLESDFLRRLAKARNLLIHGGLDERVNPDDLRKFIGILKTLREMNGAQEAHIAH